jgi:hypothetical protein
MNLVHRLLCGSAFWRRVLQEEIVPWALEGFRWARISPNWDPGPGLTTALVWRPCWPIV